jgi:mono/diheme cytochrome c family protein
MRKAIVLLFAGTLLYAAACKRKIGNDPESGISKAALQPSKDELRKRGEYLVNVIGCADCHAPKKMTDRGPVPDMDRFLSGFNSAQPIPNFDAKVMQKDQVVLFNPDLTAAAGPWGVSFAANLTPDETGIGNWTLDNFKRALTQGKSKGIEGARDLLPPMPWPNYKNMTDEDIEAVFTYLKSLKPVKNVVPNPIPPGGGK